MTSKTMEIIVQPPILETQQDMDLIDILWRQDIDLGAGREVFDYNQRQREYELEKQKQLERERLEQLQKEKETTLLAHLQLDEETGEFVPIVQHVKSENITAPLSDSSQNIDVSNQDGALSFDECMQLLAETYPFVEVTEAPTATLQPTITTQSDGSPFFTSPHSTQADESCVVRDLEEAWDVILSIPELQGLNVESASEADAFPMENKSVPLQNEDCPFYNLLTVAQQQMPDCSDGPFQVIEHPYLDTVSPTHSVNSDALSANVSFSSGGLCDPFYSALVNRKNDDIPSENVNQSFTDLLSKPPLESVDASDLTVSEDFRGGGSACDSEIPDSDSGVDMDESPRAGSPENLKGSPLYRGAPFGFKDSDLEDMDSSPGSEQDFSPAYPVCFQEESTYQIGSPLISLEQPLSVKSQDSPENELPSGPGHSTVPFTKDKQQSRAELRLSKDEQRARALNLPFSVDKIIGLPVDHFNVVMSKHQFSEAQLALIRDIRRRGKNKVAAQNCRKRKLESIVGLEHELDHLKEEKDKLLQEKGEYDRSLREVKQQLSTLYHDVFSRLRDEDGKPYSPSEYSLQQTRDGNVFLVPKSKRP